MGIVQKDSFKVMILSLLGLVLGYLNKGFLFILFFSTEQIGLVNLLVSVGMLLGNLSAFGNNYAIWRFFPYLKNPQRGHYGILRYALGMGGVGFVIFSLISFLFKDSIASVYEVKSKLFVDYYFWIIPMSAAFLVYFTLDFYMRSLYKNTFSVLIYEVGLRVLILLDLLAFGFDYISFDVFIISFCLVHFIPAIALWIYLSIKNELHIRVSPKNIPKRLKKIMLRFSLMSYSNSVAITFFATIDVIIIAAISGLKDAGVYSTIVFLASALLVPNRSMVRVSSPIVADNWKNKNNAAMQLLYANFSSINLMVSIVLFALIWVNRIDLFGFLPKEFYQGIMAFLFIMIGRIFDNFMGLNAIILITSKRYKSDIWVTVSSTILIILLNMFLIPIYGLTGAGISSMIVLIYSNIIRTYLVYRFFQLHPFEINQFKAIAFLIPLFLLGDFIHIPLDEPILRIGINTLLITFYIWIGIRYLHLNNQLLDYIVKMKQKVFK